MATPPRRRGRRRCAPRWITLPLTTGSSPGSTRRASAAKGRSKAGAVRPSTPGARTRGPGRPFSGSRADLDRPSSRREWRDRTRRGAVLHPGCPSRAPWPRYVEQARSFRVPSKTAPDGGPHGLPERRSARFQNGAAFVRRERGPSLANDTSWSWHPCVCCFRAAFVAALRRPDTAARPCRREDHSSPDLPLARARQTGVRLPSRRSSARFSFDRLGFSAPLIPRCACRRRGRGSFRVNHRGR